MDFLYKTLAFGGLFLIKRIKEDEKIKYKTKKTEILGIALRPLDMAAAEERAHELITSGKGGIVCTPNATMLYNAKNSNELKKILENADICLCDGVGVSLGARILGKGKLSRVCGVDYGEKIAELCAKKGYTLYLFGGKRGIAEKAARALIEKYPALKIAGTHHGYFEDEWRVVSEISLASPQVIFVCLGSPMQESFIYRNFRHFDGALMLGLGGSLDVYAGEVKRAPKIFRVLGFEWAYRLLKEPKRIKKTHLFSFAREVLYERFSVKIHKNGAQRERKKVKS